VRFLWAESFSLFVFFGLTAFEKRSLRLLHGTKALSIDALSNFRSPYRLPGVPNAAPPNSSRRRMLFSALALAGGIVGCRAGAPARTPGSSTRGRLRLLAEARWPNRLGFGGTTVGGLSGLDYDSIRGEYLLISDDRSDFNPARFYGMQWAASGDAPPKPIEVVTLRQSNGDAWPARRRARASVPVPDPEALRLRPDAGTLLWTSEGDEARGFGPAFYESRRDGTFVREIPLPPMFQPGADGRRGARDNLALEGLALTPNGRHAWLAMESALFQDGPLPTLSAPGGPCRFTCIELATGHATRQIAYIPDAIPRHPLIPGTHADNGVSEVLMIDADRMLVLERAYAAGVGNSLRLYEIDTRQASDTLALEALATRNYRPASKTLVADFATIGLSRLDNTEGMCWGPALPNGHRMLVVVSDDNFNPLQITQFAAFEFTE
jgi:hypothetical protein